mgnify:FL=1
MLFIFDLDGTVVDSSHRQGAGTLAEWRELNTPENISLDSELPYADVMRDAIQRDRNSVWVCTSRIMGDADFDWLSKRALMPSTIIHRTIKEDNIPAGEFKARALLRHAQKIGWTWARLSDNAIMFDDDRDVIDTLRSFDVRVVNATRYNDYIIQRGVA